MATILLVEDDEIFRELLTDVLANLGHEVRAFPSAEGLTRRMLNELRPAMAVVDVNLPGVQGDKLCLILASARGSLGMRVLLMSNLPESALAERAHQARADGYATKRKLLADPAAALRDLLPDEVLVGEIVEDPVTPEGAVLAAAGRHLKDFRTRVEVRIECDLATQGRDSDGTVFSASLQNLSVSGARLAVPAMDIDRPALAVNRPLRLLVPIGERTLEVVARVAWKGKVAGKPFAALGLSFGAVDPQVKDAIEDHVTRVFLKTLGE